MPLFGKKKEDPEPQLLTRLRELGVPPPVDAFPGITPPPPVTQVLGIPFYVKRTGTANLGEELFFAAESLIRIHHLGFYQTGAATGPVKFTLRYGQVGSGIEFWHEQLAKGQSANHDFATPLVAEREAADLLIEVTQVSGTGDWAVMCYGSLIQLPDTRVGV